MARSMDEFTSNWEEEGSSNIDNNETVYEHSHWVIQVLDLGNRAPVLGLFPLF
jgi:hypothetical protein